MNTKIKRTVKNALLAIVLIFIFAACTKKVTFLNSAIVPAAEGTVTVKQDKNNNYDISLTVKRLAEPSRLTPPKNVYVVWMETSQSGAQNLGQLETSTKGLSKMLTSSLKTVAPQQPTGFFITAEDDSNVNYPSRTVVLETGTIENK